MSDQAFDDLDMAAARAKFAPKVDGRKAARKAREKKTAGMIDGRSLRATGRTEHLNFRAKPSIKDALATHVPKGPGLSVSLWLEEAILAKFQAEGIDIDA